MYNREREGKREQNSPEKLLHIKLSPVMWDWPNVSSDTLVFDLLIKSGTDTDPLTVVGGYSDTLGDRQKCHCNRLSL